MSEANPKIKNMGSEVTRPDEVDMQGYPLQENTTFVFSLVKSIAFLIDNFYKARNVK